jgi:hypothetical protein
MRPLRTTIYAKQKAKPNTFIGGVSATLNTPALVASKLGISVARIKSFSVIGSNIQFAVIGGTYSIAADAFQSTPLTYFNDSLGLVTLINQKAFYNCTSATNYNFPALATISSSTGAGTTGTFQNNTALVTFYAPVLTSIIGTGNAFNGNTNLTTFSAPNLAGSIPLQTFQYCLNLATIITGSVTSIGGNAFDGDVKLKTINLSTCTSIGSYAFNGCVLLDTITDLNSAVTILSRAFYNCQKLPNFTANAVTSIGTSAFYNCFSVTSYSFPNLTIFDSSTGGGTQGTFQNNTALITFSAPVLTSITGTGGGFNGNINMTTFYAPILAGALGLFMFLGCAKLVTFTVGAVTSINDGFFNGCVLISAIYMPSLVTCGSTTVNNSVFLNIKSGITITVKTSLQTANSGAPDGDLVYASGTRGATIVYV